MDRPFRHRLAGATVALVFVAQCSLHADLIVLRNGQELRGRARSKGDRVWIDLDIGGTVVVARGDIARTVVEAPGSTAAEDTAISPELLARLEAREKIHVLIETLGAEKEAARLAAERQLVAVGRSALPLLRPALDEGTATQRLHLLRALTAIGDPAILPQARAILSDPKAKALHVQAATALAEIGGPRVAPELTALFVHTKDDELASVCLNALVAMRSAFAAPFVVEALQRPALRATARDAIARWRDPILLPYLLPRLAKASSDASRQRIAGWAVGLFTPGHIAAFSRLIDAHSDKRGMDKILSAGVRRLHREFPVAGDVALLDATQPQVRKVAHESLKKQFRADRQPQRRAWQAEFTQATEPRLLLVPVGRATRTVTRELAAALSKALSHPVEADRSTVPFPGPAGEPRDARRLLLHLDRRQLEDHRSLRVIGVTGLAVTAPGRERALAPTGRHRAVVLSLAGLGKGRVRSARATRLALHALARSFGIGPCAAAGCPSGPVYHARDLDAKASRYCPSCARALDQMWDAEGEAARFRYAQAGRKLSRLAGKTAELHAAAAYMFERAVSPAEAQNAWRAYQGMVKNEAILGLIRRRIELLARAAARKKPRGS